MYTMTFLGRNFNKRIIQQNWLDDITEKYVISQIRDADSHISVLLGP